MRFTLTAFAILWVNLLFVSASASADPAPDVKQLYGYGKTYAAFQIGYGHGFLIGNTGRGQAKNVEYLATLPSFGIGISDPMGGDSWYSGNFDFVTEGEFLTFLGPGDGHTAGLAIKARYNFLSLEKFVPYVEIGVGAGYLASSLDNQADGIIFYPQGVVGLNYFVSGNLALNLSYRYHHMSNRGFNKPNTGINANVGLIGVEYHF